MTTRTESASHWYALHILADHYAANILESAAGEVWEHYPEISEAAAMDLTEAIAHRIEVPHPGAVAWAERQLAPTGGEVES